MNAEPDPTLFGFFLGCLVVLAVLLLALAIRVARFHATVYAKRTGNGAFATLNDAGKRGEYRLGLQLEAFDPAGRMLFNVYVPRPDGSTSEVDAVLVSSSGIYVFENKNYSGWIFGDADEKTWTQSLNKRVRYRFLNPIKQNAGHVRALEEFLDLGEAAFVPVVVFADKTVLKKVRVGEAMVMHTSDVASRLRNIEASRKLRFTDAEADAFFEALSACTNAPAEVKQAHRTRVNAARLA